MKIIGKPTLQSNDATQLIRRVVPYLLMPHRDVVSQLNEAVFPVVRDPSQRGKVEKDKTKFGKVVMYDDNTAPRWAFLWAHGWQNVSLPPGGWMIAHVWNESKNPEAYTHVANIVLMPEFFASLSDKKGPLVDVLRYHAQEKYGWRPKKSFKVNKPCGFDDLNWKYLDKIHNPRDQVNRRLLESRDKRAIILSDLLGIQNSTD